jgi:hypothetical protein
MVRSWYSEYLVLSTLFKIQKAIVRGRNPPDMGQRKRVKKGMLTFGTPIFVRGPDRLSYNFVPLIIFYYKNVHINGLKK